MAKSTSPHPFFGTDFIIQLQPCDGLMSKPILPFKLDVIVFNSRSISLQNTIS